MDSKAMEQVAMGYRVSLPFEIWIMIARLVGSNTIPHPRQSRHNPFPISNLRRHLMNIYIRMLN